MNKKGFTLIELLVVIAILGILIGFVTVNVLKVYDRQKGKVSKQEQQSIKTAAEHVLAVLEDCDDDLDSELLNSLNLTGFLNEATCSSVATKLNNGSFDMTLAQLESTGYLSGSNLSNYSPNNKINIKKENGRWIVEVNSLNEILVHTNNDSVNNILENSNYLTEDQKADHYAEYSPTPETTPGQKNSVEDESTISSTIDDYGTTYYYRGNVANNYLNFAGMCWRIVRFQGDGSIKIILEDQDENCSNTMNSNWNINVSAESTTNKGYYGYTYYYKNQITTTDGVSNPANMTFMDYLNGKTSNPNSNKTIAYAFENFQKQVLNESISKLKVENWCINNKGYKIENNKYIELTNEELLNNKIKNRIIYYDSYVRLSDQSPSDGIKPTLKCNGTTISKFADNENMYVGTLTADEIVYAGDKAYTTNNSFYLVSGDKNLQFITLSPGTFMFGNDNIFRFGINGNTYNRLTAINQTIDGSIRPAIVLKNTVKLSGEGTKTNPYVVE